MSNVFMANVAIIVISIGMVSLSVTIVILTRWLSGLSQRVLDLEYPLQARVNMRKQL